MNIGPGRVLSVSLVLSWLALLTFQVSRSFTALEPEALVDLGPPSAGEAELTQRGVYYRGARIGFIRERLTPLEQGYRAEQTGRFTLTVLGRERHLQIEGSATSGSDGELRQFQFRLTTAAGRSPFETTVTGRVEEGVLVLTIDSGGSARTERRTLDGPIALPLNLYYALASRGWTPGATYRLRLFDPMTLSEGEAVVEVRDPEIVRWGGREEEAHRVLTTFAGLTTTAWLNERGEVLQEETPLGWTLLKEAPGSSLAASTPSTEAAPDLLVSSSLPAIGFAGDAAALESATLKLVNFPDGYDALEGGRQTTDGDLVHVRREKPPFEIGPAPARAELAAALASDGFVQSDDPAIVAAAHRITGGADAEEKARVLTLWVYENVAKSPTLSIPSAREVLEQRVGDCNEHTVLFTALARAAELPTRIATGLAYTGGQFYYHAWPEVWLGRWVAVDPTFGQFPADVLHLRLLTGGLESQYEVLQLLGRSASVEVIQSE